MVAAPETIGWCFRGLQRGFPGSSEGKESAYSAGDLGLIPGLGRSPGEGKGNLPQYSWLENPMNRGAWSYMHWATVHGIAGVGHNLVTKPFLRGVLVLYVSVQKEFIKRQSDR